MPYPPHLTTTFTLYQFFSQNVVWFNIGSLEAFERNLETIQADMNVEPTNYIPVVYKSETEM